MSTDMETEAREFFEDVCTNSRKFENPLIIRRSIECLGAPNLTAKTRFYFTFARDVCRRHLGEPILLPFPSYQQLVWSTDHAAADPRNRRLEVIAHVIQSAADGETSVIDDYIELAKPYYETSFLAGAAKIRGAIGRALAALRRYDGAVAVLHEAVDYWLEFKPDEGSYALCELLRLAGIQRQPLDGLMQDVAAMLPALDVGSRPFLHLALGRAQVQVGAFDDGIKSLQMAFEATQAHVQFGGRRWAAYAHVEKGDFEGAEAHRAKISATGEFGPEEQHVYALCDLALHEHAALPGSLFELAESASGHDFRTAARLAFGSVEAVLGDPEKLKEVLWESRY